MGSLSKENNFVPLIDSSINLNSQNKVWVKSLRFTTHGQNPPPKQENIPWQMQCMNTSEFVICKAYSEHIITESQNSNDVTKARTKTWRNFSKKVRLVESMHVQLEFFLIVLNMDSSLLASSTSTVV